jgi:nitrogen fixation NifU-like protein
VNEGLRELYQEVILDHGKRPRNFRAAEGATHSADGFNPLCGDKVHLEIRLDGDIIADAAFTGQGCAISTASASMMTEALKGRTLEQARELFDGFHTLVTGGEAAASAATERVGKLAVFSGVRDFPTRVKCAVLVWHTLNQALEGKSEPAVTE